MRIRVFLASAALALCAPQPGGARADDTHTAIRAAADASQAAVIAWRRDIHQHPELGNREHRTADLVARTLRALGFDEVHTGVAHTGVVGVLRGGLPGGVVALRADMDALPVEEQSGLPFASRVRMNYNGAEVPVMHACGHDAHTAILLGVAQVLSGLREQLPGTVAFIFQPAEEGPPQGEEGGARMMIAEGLWALAHHPTAIFGLHTWPGAPGSLMYRSGPTMAAADTLRITVTGRQTHGSQPWGGIDPIIVAAQIVTALQTIPSRQLDITRAPSVVTIGSIHGGVRHNIIPDSVDMTGTIRNFDEGIRRDMHERIRRTATAIAAASGAEATVSISSQGEATHNDPDLTAQMLPTLRASAGDNLLDAPLIMASEDFSEYQKDIPGLFFFLGVNRDGVSAAEAAPNHSPLYFVNEDALVPGVRALSMLAVDYLRQHPGR